MHATQLANLGVKYLADLQIDDLSQLRDELDTLWNNGQAKVSNTVYDKATDGINYEVAQLKNDPYDYAGKRNDQQLKKLLDYFSQLHSQGRALIEDFIWDILNQDVSMRNVFNGNLTTTYPSQCFCPGGLIGGGVYFAVNASYSNQNSYVLKKTSCRRELFICQVLLGKSSQGRSSLLSPAPGCHSVYNCNDSHYDMFCIFNSYQAYPEYIVQYDYS